VGACVPAHLGNNQADARRSGTRIDKGLWPSRAVIVVQKICHAIYLVTLHRKGECASPLESTPAKRTALPPQEGGTA
jgi:hypothetical protein